MEASLTGMASNVLWAAGLTAWEAAAMKITYAVTVSAAAVMLCRAVWKAEKLKTERLKGNLSFSASQRFSFSDENYEYACGVLFMMMVPPYLILYDQTLLAIPLVMLWSSPAWRWGVALFATATVLVVNFSLVLGFGFTGIVALAAMFFLNRSFDFLKNRPRFQMEDRIAFRDTNRT